MDNDNFHGIIGLKDFADNLDKSEVILNEKIFIIVYLYYLKYFENNFIFNQNTIFFKEDSEFEWKFRLELSDYKRDFCYYHPTTFAFIYNSTVNLKHPFLCHIKNVIYEFISSKTNNKKFMMLKTEEFLRNDEDLKEAFNLIFDLESKKF